MNLFMIAHFAQPCTPHKVVWAYVTKIGFLKGVAFSCALLYDIVVFILQYKEGESMESLSDCMARRDEILAKMGEIPHMVRGSLVERYESVKHKDGETVRKGPYHTLTRTGKGGKTVSKCVSTTDVPLMRQGVDNYREFRRLADEYAEVCEKVFLLSSPQPQEDAKKN
jgi:hypothetical protein